METKETAVKLLKISNKIQEIYEHWAEIDSGDFQGLIEAQVRISYLLGKETK